jgi:hypothetical protein
MCRLQAGALTTPSRAGISLLGLSSTYFHFPESTAFFNSSAMAAALAVLSSNGSQWSENGTDTIRRPVSQLFTWQNTMPFERGEDGGVVVYTTGL